jgi:glycerol kinase
LFKVAQKQGVRVTKTLILALDQGTTSTRAILFDAHGQPLATASRKLTQSYPADGWVEHDAAEIYRASVEVLREAVETSGRPVSQIAAIGVTNQRETVAVWSKATGEPIAPAIVWQDRRTAGVCETLRAAGHEPDVTAATGLILDAYFSGPKIAWLLDSVPGAREAAERGQLLAGTMDSWVIWKLTGGDSHVTDATNASRTLLFDIHKQAWSPAMLALMKVPAACLPQVLDCAAPFGTLDPAILGAPVPICGVAGDQQAALMGQGCLKPGEMKATYGTGAFMLLNTGEKAAVSHSRLLTTVAARLNGRTTYALEGSIFIAGAAIDWLGGELGVAGGPKAAEALAMSARAGHGVVMVPAFTGLGAPWWDPAARGAILGLTRDSGLAEICAATFDACALQTRDLIEAMRADAPHAFEGDAELRVDGGMIRSAWYCRRLADITNLTVQRVTYQEMTALGAALFAGIGAGVYASAEDAIGARPPSERLDPDPDRHGPEADYARWLDAIPRVR